MTTRDASRSTLVFIGDSITAAGRDLGDAADLGQGYVADIAATLEAQHPSLLHIVNRGVGGDRAGDVECRWRVDCLDHEPDVVTLLVGVNDTWRRFDRGQSNPIDAYAASLHSMASQTRELTGARLVLVEPFVLQVGVVTPAWTSDLAARRAVVADVARAYDAALIAAQDAFDGAAATAHPATLLQDGVHPTAEGHRLLADLWLETAAVEWIAS